LARANGASAGTDMSPLGTRIVVGVLLIAVALAAVWTGGIAFTALVTLAVLLMFAEWSVMHGISRGLRLIGLAVLAGSCALAVYGPALQSVIALAAGAGLLGLFARGLDRKRAFWIASGMLYCGLPGVSLLWLRGLPTGLVVTVAVLTIVWATDIVAFFAGRLIGGPKLAPSISPNKTWAGAVGGVVGAIAIAMLAGIVLQWRYVSAAPAAVVALAGGLAMLAVLGDLFESWLKRRAGVKDSGTLLPGHGGVLDRLDGLVPVAVTAAMIVAWQSLEH